MVTIIHEAYSKWDLTKLLYRGTNFTPFSDTNDLLMIFLEGLAQECAGKNVDIHYIVKPMFNWSSHRHYSNKTRIILIVFVCLVPLSILL